jgi:uncharacterized protein (TIGR00251 family)
VPSAGTDATTLRVRVQPRASRQAILGWREDVLRVAVTAPPVEGEANEAVRRLLARALGVAPSAVHVVRGERGRDKLVRVDGVTGSELHARLAAQDRTP